MKELWHYEGKTVELTLNDGRCFRGYVGDYIRAEDNVIEQDSIVLNLAQPHSAYPVEFFADEIISIVILDASGSHFPPKRKRKKP